jgi:hypothetical protein
VAAARPCPEQQPRLFPGAHTELPAEGRIVLLVRPELAADLAALEKAPLALEANGKTIPLKKDASAANLRSAVGEHVLIYKATKLLQPGRTYKLVHLPKLPPAWESLGTAEWPAVASSRKAPEVVTKKIGRTYCASIAADARVCGVALLGTNGTDEPLLLSAEIKPADEHLKGKLPVFVDVIIPEGELILHNQVCDSDLSKMIAGKYDAVFRLTDPAGRTGQPWKAKIEVRDLNEEMAKMPGLNR